MADYEGILLISEEDLIGAFIPLIDSLIAEQDAAFFMGSYTPTEGCEES